MWTFGDLDCTIFYIAAYSGNAEQRKRGAGSAASHLGSCGSAARDVLPWQPSSTDPLMGLPCVSV